MQFLQTFLKAGIIFILLDNSNFFKTYTKSSVALNSINSPKTENSKISKLNLKKNAVNSKNGSPCKNRSETIASTRLDSNGTYRKDSSSLLGLNKSSLVKNGKKARELIKFVMKEDFLNDNEREINTLSQKNTT